MERHGRRVAADKLEELCDIGVDAKPAQVVMIFANAQGRRVVKAIFPDVQWTTDEFFAKGHSPDWLFTHILVTKLPPELEARKPLTLVSPDAIGMAVAMALQTHHSPGVFFTTVASPLK